MQRVPAAQRGSRFAWGWCWTSWVSCPQRGYGEVARASIARWSREIKLPRPCASKYRLHQEAPRSSTLVFSLQVTPFRTCQYSRSLFVVGLLNTIYITSNETGNDLLSFAFEAVTDNTVLIVDISFEVPCQYCHSWNVVKSPVCWSTHLEIFRHAQPGKANTRTHSQWSVYVHYFATSWKIYMYSSVPGPCILNLCWL